MELSVPLAARREWSQMWFGDGAKALVARKTGSVSGDLELETLKKRFQSNIQKPVTWRIGLLSAQLTQLLCSSFLRGIWTLSCLAVFYFWCVPLVLRLTSSFRCLDDNVGSLGAKGTCQPRGLGSRLVLRGTKKRAGSDSPQSRDRWDLRHQSFTFSRVRELDWRRRNPPSLFKISEKVSVHSLTLRHPDDYWSGIYPHTWNFHWGHYLTTSPHPSFVGLNLK